MKCLVFQKKTSSYTSYEQDENIYLEQKYILEEHEGLEQNSFFQDNIFEQETSIVEFSEDSNLESFSK